MNDNHLLEVLTREGVLLNVSVRFWRAAKKLQASDLGLDPDDVTDRLISLGHKKLLPREALAPFALIESRAHALVDSNTFPFLNGLGHFLPNRKLTEVTGKLNALETEFRAAQAEFVERYARLRASAITEWHEAARKLVRDPDRVVTSIQDAFPPANRLDRYFTFAVNLFQIRVPERLETDLVSAADQEEVILARQRAAQEARARIAAGVETFVGDCVASLREQTAQLCDEMLASFRDGKTGVHQKTLNRLVTFMDQFKALNFAGDQQLEERLEAVRKQFLTRTAEAYRDDDRARARLTQGIANLANAARELAHADSREIVERFGQMGVRRFQLEAA
jgi:hypothetical protein